MTREAQTQYLNTADMVEKSYGKKKLLPAENSSFVYSELVEIKVGRDGVYEAQDGGDDNTEEMEGERSSKKRKIYTSKWSYFSS